MDQNKENQISDLYGACEQINNVFCSVYNIAVNVNAPIELKTDLADITSELHNAIFRIANYIALPHSENTAPELDKKLTDFLEVVADKSCGDKEFSSMLVNLPTQSLNALIKSINK